ncbi:replicative DNA helicase [Iodidimonas nitroreducens]|uniref:Replicative DNA helicase n=2 Tax=Iodidimonas nitroreducens TaxID=1236968 RepID=A0A5A7N4K8_9PROT|nr:replicative DNA helicase [Iodidimonas nitroreducens]
MDNFLISYALRLGQSHGIKDDMSEHNHKTVTLHPGATHEQPSPESLDYRQPPSNLEIEQALLGAMLVNNEAAEQVREFLQPEHFHEPVHGRIYDMILRLIDRDHTADPVKLRPFFDQDEALAEMGGGTYLARLAASAATIINATDYARTLRDLALRRALISVGQDMVITAYDADPSDSGEGQLEAAESRLFDLAQTGSANSSFTPFRTAIYKALEAAEAAYKDPDKISGVSTGLKALDAQIGGLHKTDLLILAGRPAMGKTSLATNIAYNAAMRWLEDRENGVEPKRSRGAAVAFFSLEMSADQLAARIVSDRANIKSEEMRRGRLTDRQFEDLTRAVQEIENLPLYIDDTAALSIAGVYTRARRLKRLHNIGLVIVDYLQLLSGSAARAESRVQEISEITRGLKALAKKLEVPVMALSQLSRTVESRDNKRPQLSDLRESGSIEQDSDIVMFVYRDEYYKEQAKPDEGDEKKFAEWMDQMERARGLAEVIVSKQRHGPTGTVRLRFIKETTRFTDEAVPEYTAERIG